MTKPMIWKRNAVKQSGSLYIAMPKAWTESQGIEASDRVRIELMNDGNLKLSPEVSHD